MYSQTQIILLYAIDPNELKGDIITIPEFAQRERPFVEMIINHGKNPQDASYAYAILPYADESKTSKYAADPDFKIISNTKECQAVQEKTLGITGIVFYEAGECSGVKVDKACIVTFSVNSDEFKIKVCEPTNKESRVTVEIDSHLIPIVIDNHYTIEYSDKTKLVLDVSSSVGKGYEAIFKISK